MQGSTLKSRRLKNKLTQAQAAVQLGVSPAQLSKMENGVHPVNDKASRTERLHPVRRKKRGV